MRPAHRFVALAFVSVFAAAAIWDDGGALESRAQRTLWNLPRFSASRRPLSRIVADQGRDRLSASAASFAFASSDGAQGRVLTLKPGGPARESAVAADDALPLSDVKPLFELAYQLECGGQAPWSSLWKSRSEQFPPWVLGMREAAGRSRVPLAAAFASLAEIRRTFRAWPQLRERLRQMSGQSNAFRFFGGQVAAYPSAPRARGPSGFIGWIADDRPAAFVVRGPENFASGSSRVWRDDIEAALGARAATATRACVEAVYRPRGGLRAVRDVFSGERAEDGALEGYFQASLASGEAREFLANGDLELVSTDAGGRYVRATFTLEDYAARAVDRAGVASEPEAAKAVALLARSEVASWPADARGCREMPIVNELLFSLSPPSASAVRAARWTSDLAVMVGPAATIASLRPSPPSAFGKAARDLAGRGLYFDEIVAQMRPSLRAVLGRRPATESALASQN